MNNEIKKQIPRSILFALVCIILGIGIQIRYEWLLGLSVVLIGAMIIALNVWLSRCSGIFVSEEYNKESAQKYSQFAYFYLKDRGLNYSEKTFRAAIKYKWTDIVSMCLLLGIHKALPVEETRKIVREAFENDDLNTFKLLMKVRFCKYADLTAEQEAPFLFFAMRKQDTGYMEWLLKYGANPNEQNIEGEYPIFIAIEEQRQDVVAKLIEYKVDLKNVKKEGLAPMFFALAKESFEICERIYDTAYAKKSKDKLPFKIEEIEGSISFSTTRKYLTQEEMLMYLISSKDKEVWRVIRDLFNHKENYKMNLKQGTELYARLSYITGEYMLHTNKSIQARETYSKESCHQDLLGKVIKHYKVSPIGKYQIDHIYREPRCIESKLEQCETCKGKGILTCETCGGKGTEVCPECSGKGKVECSKCHGTRELNCWDVKPYEYCKNCREGYYVCSYCDPKGEETCPTCKGYGTTRCKCPPNKKKPCPHCEKGFVKVSKDSYVKCTKCQDGWICSECNGTGWLTVKSPKNLCPTCQGKGKIKCTHCSGKKKIKCGKAHRIECDCHKGLEKCLVCQGEKEIQCKTCGGWGKQNCPDCQNGHIYTNIYLDFKCKNYLAQEAWLGEIKSKYFEKNMPKNMIESILQDNQYADIIYTLKKLKIKPEDIHIHNKEIEEQVREFVTNTKEHQGVVEILEIVPFIYENIVLESTEGKKWNFIFIKEHYVTAIKGELETKSDLEEKVEV